MKKSEKIDSREDFVTGLAVGSAATLTGVGGHELMENYFADYLTAEDIIGFSVFLTGLTVLISLITSKAVHGKAYRKAKNREKNS